MLRSIHIRGFRCFDDLTLDLSGPRGTATRYTAVLGRNGSGKSALVEAVDFLCGTMRSFPTDGGPMRSVESLAADVRREMTAGSDAGPEVSIEFVIDGDRGEYSVSFGADGLLESESLSFRVGARKGCVMSAFRKNGGYDVFINRRSVPDRRLRDEISTAADRFLGAHTLLSVVVSIMGASNPEHMGRLTDPDLRRAVGFLTSINRGPGGNRMSRICSSPLSGTVDRSELPALEAYGRALDSFLCRIDPDTLGARYDVREDRGKLAYELRVVKRIAGERREIPASSESDGTLSLISVLPLLLNSAGGGVSVVDDLGSEVHESLLADILDEMLPVLKGQLIFTTHNLSLLETLDPRCVTVIDVDTEGRRSANRIRDVVPIRRGYNVRSMYLRGEMGGVPAIGRVDIDHIAERLGEELRCWGRRTWWP